MSDEWWRVQASWRDGDQQRSYAPVYVRGEGATAPVVNEMRDNLWHFVGLDIEVRLAVGEEISEADEWERFEAEVGGFE